MSEREREKWNRRYQQGTHLTGPPDSFLVEAHEEYIAPRFPRAGHALDLAGGAGRHAVWLAQRGWRVTLTDIAQAGIAKARETAAQARVKLQYCVADAADLQLGRARFDLIVVFYFLDRNLFPRLKAALRPGGLLVYKTLTVDQPQPWRGPRRHFLKRNELLRAIPGLQVLHYRETMRPSAQQSRSGSAVAEMVALKPLSRASARALR